MINTSIKILLFTICFTSCQHQNNQNQVTNAESKRIFKTAIEIIRSTDYKINIDSIKDIYESKIIENSDSGINYANRFKKYAVNLKNIAIYDSLRLEYKNKSIENNKDISKKVIELWKKSKAGKIQLKHPNWTKEDCIKISKNEIWIGMTLEMLKYLRGNPNSANPSNYGNGVRWQWCWDNYSPSCFYGNSNGIITSYN